MRLIDVEALMQEMKDEVYIQVDDFEIIAKVSRSAPTIEAKPVVHAHWLEQIIDGSQELMCSNCGEYALMNDEFYSEFSKYCPYCGAQMDEKED